MTSHTAVRQKDNELGTFTTFYILAACAQNRRNKSLVSTTWKLTSYGLADSPKPTVPESEGMIIFDANGTATGIGACNQFSGEYEVKGEHVAVSAINWGRKSVPTRT